MKNINIIGSTIINKKNRIKYNKKVKAIVFTITNYLFYCVHLQYFQRQIKFNCKLCYNNNEVDFNKVNSQNYHSRYETMISIIKLLSFKFITCSQGIEQADKGK